jgi:ABC-type glycerol-3-phosphate transport system permease component
MIKGQDTDISTASPTSPASTQVRATEMPVPSGAGQGGARRLKRAAAVRRFFTTGTLHLVLVAMSFTFILPFVWMVLSANKHLSQVGVGSWLPRPPAVYKELDILDPAAVIAQMDQFADQLPQDKRQSVHRALAELPAEPWTSSEFDDVRASLTVLLTRMVEEPASQMATVLPVDNLKFEPGVKTLEQQAAVERFKVVYQQARQALEQAYPVGDSAQPDQTAEGLAIFATPQGKAAEKARAGYVGALKLLNRRLMDDMLGAAVRPTHAWQWENFLDVFRQIPFARYYVNSIFLACCITFLQVFTSSLAAFAFARLDWPGRDKVFLLYLSTMMLPGLVMMIPNYQIMIELGLVDTMIGLVLPGAFTAFGTFLLRQFMLTIPRSLDEAAEIDGASKWRVYWDIILPMARPGLITLAIFTFMGAYHNFFWPLVMLKSQHKYTLPIGLLYFDSSAGQETNLLMAAVTMSVVPMIIVFIVLQKQLIKGIQLGAVKG